MSKDDTKKEPFYIRILPPSNDVIYSRSWYKDMVGEIIKVVEGLTLGSNTINSYRVVYLTERQKKLVREEFEEKRYKGIGLSYGISKRNAHKLVFIDLMEKAIKEVKS